MDILKIIANISDIIVKYLPTKKERYQDALAKLEKELEQALINNDTPGISIARARMKMLRNKIKELE